MESQMFKKATIGGFDKQSVMNYIYQLNNNAQEAQDQLNARLQEAEADRAALGQTLKDLEGKVQAVIRERDGFSNELRVERKRTGELSELIDTLNEERMTLESALSAKDEEVRAAKRFYRDLEDKNKELEGKSGEVEKASAHIGELMLRIRTESEQMLTDAGARAEELKREASENIQEMEAAAEEKAKAIEAEAVRQAEEILRDAAAKAKNLTEGADVALELAREQFKSFRGDMEEIRNQIITSMEAVNEKFDAVNSAVDAAGNALEGVSPQELTLHLVSPVEPEQPMEEPVPEYGEAEGELLAELEEIEEQGSVQSDSQDGDEFFRSAAEN